MGLADTTVIVTGGAQGIGMAVSQAFAREGAFVVIADIDSEAGQEWEWALTGEDLKAWFVRADVSDEEHVKRLIQKVVDKRGGIHALINNAGITWQGTLAERETSQWEHVLAVNLRGPYLCSKYAVPHMPSGAAIVNVASTRAFMSEPNTEPYSASKGGLAALTHSLAVTLGEKGIRANCVSPGWIDVSNWKKGAVRKQVKLSKRDHAQHPVGRVGKPEDIAQACLFLADSDKSGFITGQNLIVDGGMTVKMIYER
ncbi:MAG: SDR family oxidoreductase [Candidatus Hydrogenedentes bacterium]|nr:SDR family oxidoreductase [Candidatus Hydrogenedentota bacterium]